MPWNGSGTFNRIYSWVADKAAGLDISSTRMDTDTDDIATSGFGNCITRDGQGQPTANLPMATFRHTGVGNGVARSDYASLGQAQDSLVQWTIAAGTSDAITATYTPSQGNPADGQLYAFRATAANATTTPTFAPNSQTARTITKAGGAALAVGDIPGNLAEVILRYNNANTRYELVNPASGNNVVGTGDVKLTLKTAADTGWLLFDDGTFGSASSGSSNSNSAANQALFTLFFNNLSDSAAPLFTSTGSSTTRAGQGTAAAAWAANCRMSLNKTLGRALAVAGAGSGLTSRALGANLGAETATLANTNLPPYTPSGSITNPSNSIPIDGAVGSTGSTFAPGNGSTASFFTSGNVITSTFAGSAQGGTSTPFSIMQPSSFFNIMVKQ